MQRTGFQPDQFTFASVLSACTKMGALEEGVGIHHSVKERGILSDVVVATALVDMYAKCGSIEKERELFDKMPERTVVSWNAMTAGYEHNGFLEKALEIFKEMHISGVKPDSTTFVSILPACAKMGTLEYGMNIHQSIIKGGFLSQIVVGNALLDMYVRCGSIRKAREVFDRMPERDVISWNAMIAGYAQNGFGEKAFKSFKQMQLAGVKPNSTTFASILRLCQNGSFGTGYGHPSKHNAIKNTGILSDVEVATTLVDMYAKCGSIDKARELFDKMPQKNVV